MHPTPVIALFDIGKTNKKLFLFDEQYRIVWEHSATFAETTDEDGDACEDLESLRLFVFDALREVFRKKAFEVKAINFSAYGASLVYIDKEGHPVAPLYNYLKAYPQPLQAKFYASYGGPEAFSVRTASPVLGSLNSGMQLYRLQREKPALFARVKYALHLPQYMSYILSGHACSDITSIGCHTGLWDFEQNSYHAWVVAEGVAPKLAPIEAGDTMVPALIGGNSLQVGIGLHDSSAALIPYLMQVREPFVLISTGTWCISLNPFNSEPLTVEELRQDCLCYLTYKGTPVKAARVFAGHEHEAQTKRIADHFGVSTDFIRTLQYNAGAVAQGGQPAAVVPQHSKAAGPIGTSGFAQRDLAGFATSSAAYHQFISDLVQLQHASTSLVLKGSPVKKIFVDGGFSKNKIFMQLLAAAFPALEVFAATMAQASALGAALVLHQHWNNMPVPDHLMALEHYPPEPTRTLS